MICSFISGIFLIEMFYFTLTKVVLYINTNEMLQQFVEIKIMKMLVAIVDFLAYLYSAAL